MPELPEVERARKLIQESCKGYKIVSVDTTEDKIVYTGGTNHDEFAKEITGRTITGCERKGKTFWMTLSGDGRLPVMHFGMTGMIQLKGHEPTWYRRRPRESSDVWPPRFYKFVLKLEPQEGSISTEPRELAFLDGRRLGRLRLLPSPVTDHPPVSALGFDPVLSHPSLEEFKNLLSKKKGTIKGVIMDQAFSAGVGNWVADEVLYQARIHPSCPVPLLSEQNIIDLHQQIRQVPLTAVEVNADSKLFPEDWLFRWRWGKGAKQKKGSKKAKANAVEEGDEGEEEDLKPKNKDFLALPNGKPATIVYIEVGGRTTAVVEELQKMPEGVEIKPKISKGGKGSQSKKRKAGSDSDDSDGGQSSLSALSDDEKPARVTTPRQKAAASKKNQKKIKSEPAVKMEAKTETPVKKARKSSVKDSPVSQRKTASGTKTKKSVQKSGGRGKGLNGRGRGTRQDNSGESSDLSDAP